MNYLNLVQFKQNIVNIGEIISFGRMIKIFSCEDPTRYVWRPFLESPRTFVRYEPFRWIVLWNFICFRIQ